MLHPRPRVEQQRVTNPRATLLEAYFRVNGPATKTLYRDWQQAGSTGVANDWNDVAQPLVKVKVDSKRLDLPESLLDDLRTADSPEGVALLPPNDAYLRQTDRTLLVPDATRRRTVFKSLSGPGALVVDGEIPVRGAIAARPARSRSSRSSNSRSRHGSPPRNVPPRSRHQPAMMSPRSRGREAFPAVTRSSRMRSPIPVLAVSGSRSRRTHRSDRRG